MAKFTVFESTNMASTKYAERIFDCVYMDGDVENGTFGYLGDQIEEGSHIYKFVPGYKEGEKSIVADQPAWDYDTSRITNQRRDKFVIETGTPFRARVVKLNDEFGVTIEGFTPETRDKAKVGAFAAIDKTTGKLVASAALAEGAHNYGKIMRKRVIGGTLVTAAHNYGYKNDMYEIRITG